jgi:uncharacterized protein
MTVEYLLLMTVIGLLSVVQSVFGMGVLVFGTPTLLLLGYDFATTLSYLLPASFAISLFQVISARSLKVRISRYLYLLCLPGICVGLWLVDLGYSAPWTDFMIGGVLLLSALVRILPWSRLLLTRMLETHYSVYHLILGIVHGLTNLGGALLAILASGTSNDKVVIRYTIAHYYLAFSTIQMLFLATVMGLHDRILANLPMAAVSACVYLTVGNRIFSRASNPIYDLAMTAFIIVYGVIVLVEF